MRCGAWFPLDWNHWQIDEWPQKIEEIQSVCDLPVWVTEVRASSFGADEVQTFGFKADNGAFGREGGENLLVQSFGSSSDMGSYHQT